MCQVNRCILEEDTLFAESCLHGNREHLLVGRVDVKPLVGANLELGLVEPHCDMLDAEACLKTFE